MEITCSPDGFINMLNNQNGGALVTELDRELKKGIEAILDHGGSSEITLKIKIGRIKSMEKAVSVSHDVITRFPKEERLSQAMFLSNGNGLLIQPQSQTALDFEQAAPVEKKLDLAEPESAGLKLVKTE